MSPNMQQACQYVARLKARAWMTEHGIHQIGMEHVKSVMEVTSSIPRVVYTASTSKEIEK